MFITRRPVPFLMETPSEDAGAGQAPDLQGTPDPANQQVADQTQAEIDWQKRYGDLQPEYTRATQEAAQLRRERELYQAMVTSDDPDTRRQAAQELGYQLDDEPDDTQYQDDPVARLEQQLEELRQQYTGDRQQAQQQQRLAELEAVAEREMDSLGVPKGQEGNPIRDWIVSRAVALPPNDKGFPDIAAAHQEFEALMLAQKKSWAGTKRAPHISAVGQAGTQAPNLDDDQQRQAWMADRLADMDAAS